MNSEPRENNSDPELASALERALETPLSQPAFPAPGTLYPAPGNIAPGVDSVASNNGMDNLFDALLESAAAQPNVSQHDQAVVAPPPGPVTDWDKPVMEPVVATPQVVEADPLGDFVPRTSFVPADDVALSSLGSAEQLAETPSESPVAELASVPVETLTYVDQTYPSPRPQQTSPYPQRPSFDDIVFGRRA